MRRPLFRAGPARTRAAACIGPALVATLGACAAAPDQTPLARAGTFVLVALPVESPTFPKSAKLATDLFRRARVKGFGEPTLSKVSLEVIQLSIECVEPTLDCYEAVGRSLSANLLLFGELEPGAHQEEVKFTVSLLDVDGKRWRKRAAKLFPSEDDAAYGMKDVLNEVTR